jgi:hypothetical protein
MAMLIFPQKINIDGHTDFFHQKINMDGHTDFFIKNSTWMVMLIFSTKNQHGLPY